MVSAYFQIRLHTIIMRLGFRHSQVCLLRIVVTLSLGRLRFISFAQRRKIWGYEQLAIYIPSDSLSSLVQVILADETVLLPLDNDFVCANKKVLAKLLRVYRFLLDPDVGGTSVYVQVFNLLSTYFGAASPPLAYYANNIPKRNLKICSLKLSRVIRLKTTIFQTRLKTVTTLVSSQENSG